MRHFIRGKGKKKGSKSIISDVISMSALLSVLATIKRCLLIGSQRRWVGWVRAMYCGGDFWVNAVKRLNKQVAAKVLQSSHLDLIKNAAIQSRLTFVHVA